MTEMLDKMDFVIMPVLNVDGYVFTWNPVCIHLFVSIYNLKLSHSINLLFPEGNQHIMSPYIVTSESNVKVKKIKI